MGGGRGGGRGWRSREGVRKEGGRILTQSVYIVYM